MQRRAAIRVWQSAVNSCPPPLYVLGVIPAEGKMLNSKAACCAADCEGHGTHVAAVVGGVTYGVAKDAKLHALRILDCEGNGAGAGRALQGYLAGQVVELAVSQPHSLCIICLFFAAAAVSDVLLALDWLKQHAQRPAIAGMSLGGALSPLQPLPSVSVASSYHVTTLIAIQRAVCLWPAGEVQLQLDEAVRSVADAGIHVVVAAGNEDMDACDTSPAREASAVTVAATTEGDDRLWLSPGVLWAGGGRQHKPIRPTCSFRAALPQSH